MVVSSVVNNIFRDCKIHVTPRRGSGKKGKQSKSWSNSAGKRKVKESKGEEKSKGASSLSADLGAMNE